MNECKYFILLPLTLYENNHILFNVRLQSIFNLADSPIPCKQFFKKPKDMIHDSARFRLKKESNERNIKRLSKPLSSNRKLLTITHVFCNAKTQLIRL